MKKIKGWHFCKDWRSRDGQKVVVGKTYTVEGELVMCKRGLHLSRRIIDALQYAPGNIICKVEGWGDVQEGKDKLVCRNRKVLAAIDGERILHEAACHFAETALKKAGVTDKRAWNAIKTKRLWLDGKATSRELDTAEAAAHASYAAGTAACAAACAAAHAATHASYAAAYASYAAKAAEAARAAAKAKQNRYLTRVVNKAMRGSTR